MTLASHPHQIAKRMEDLFKAEKADTNAFGLMDIFYGDQETVGQTPTLCIEAGDTTSPLSGAPNMVTRQHECFLILYHGQYQSAQVSKYECEVLGAQIQDWLDSNLQLKDYAGDDPLVTHGWVVQASPGYRRKEKNILQAVLLTWQGIAKTRLGA